MRLLRWACMVWSISPSPPSATIASALSGGALPYRAESFFSASCASLVSLATKAIFSKRGMSIRLDQAQEAGTINATRLVHSKCLEFGADGESMANYEQPVLIYTTFPSLEDAKGVGDALVAARLAACVNIFPGMISIFEGKGAREETNEVAMIIKTRGSLTEAVLKETK